MHGLFPLYGGGLYIFLLYGCPGWSRPQRIWLSRVDARDSRSFPYRVGIYISYCHAAVPSVHILIASGSIARM